MAAAARDCRLLLSSGRAVCGASRALSAPESRAPRAPLPGGRGRAREPAAPRPTLQELGENGCRWGLGPGAPVVAYGEGASIYPVVLAHSPGDD